MHLHLIPPALAALIQVILIDIAMAGDNAVVIGLAAARVPQSDRRKVVFGGLVAAVVLRLVLAIAVAHLLKISVVLLFAGGVLLLWVAWRLYRDIHRSHEERIGASAIAGENLHEAVIAAPLDLRRIVMQIAVADLSMSLDNVLAVAGAAMNDPLILVIGLMLSIALMGFAASMVARLLQRHPWISYAGLTIVIYVALRMIYFGGVEIGLATWGTS